MNKLLKKWLKSIVKPIIEHIKDGIALCYIKKVSSKKIGKFAKVAFIVFEPESWDKLQPVYEEMLKREEFDPWLVIVPSFDNNLCLEKEYGYEKCYFEKKYDKIILAFDEVGSVVDLKKYDFDYVFYQDPYNVHYPPKINSKSVVKYARVCYIPYGYTISTDFSDLLLQNKDFFRNVSVFFADSISVGSIMKTVFGKGYKRGIQQIKELGYPPFEQYESWNNNNINSIAWTPRWSYDIKVGGSHFFEYKDSFIALREQYPNFRLIFRPHPMLFANMINTQKMSVSEVDQYKKLLNEKKIETLDKSPINDVLEGADILISDVSSVIPSYFMSGRPVIYCKSNLKVNNEFNKILEGIYVATSWEDVDMYIREIVSGNDYLKEKREQIIHDGEFSIHHNASINIVDFLKKNAGEDKK